MLKSIHPFPARMAPSIAMADLKRLPPGSIVLDPMAGSGTVLRHAAEMGHSAVGFDLDPLAVLMSRVWTTPVDDAVVGRALARVVKEVRTRPARQPYLPWIDEDKDTRHFINYWFARRQQAPLRRLAHAITRLTSSSTPSTSAAGDVLKVALSRIIITKDRGASLARDVSHSRPHRVADMSDYDVLGSFEVSVSQIRRLLYTMPAPGNVRVGLGDARNLTPLANRSVDAVLTSPPYLNAIDYMRGHRLALVWLGHRVLDLRRIRSVSVGVERGRDSKDASRLFDPIERAMCRPEHLSTRHASMVGRYAEDLYRLMSEIARVLKSGGQATLVVGNSCLKDVFIKNSRGVESAASMVGLELERKAVRKLPNNKRYLPIMVGAKNPLGKRMRTESVLTFRVS